MRSRPTVAERVLWSRLRGLPFRVRRQHVFYPYIVDFYAKEKALCVEVDGPCHEARLEADVSRDGFLDARYGVRVLRFTNDDVLRALDEVVACVERSCR